MVCPSCKGEDCVRSRRHGFVDRVVSFAALRPWRCMKCRRRFYAHNVAVDFMRHAHCRKCGNLEPRYLGKKWVGEGKLRLLLRMPGAHAYRCDDCRLNFHSFRTLYNPRGREAHTAADHLAGE